MLVMYELQRVLCAHNTPLLLQFMKITLYASGLSLVVSITFIMRPPESLVDRLPSCMNTETPTNYNLIKSYVITMSGSYLQGIYRTR